MKNVMIYTKCALSLLPLLLTGVVCAADFAEPDAYQQALNYYNQGEYEQARKLVDKNYSIDNGSFALLLALLFVRDHKCEEALGVIEYISKYYDSNRHEVNSNEGTKWLYVNMKKVSIKCYQELSKWYELEKDLLIYQEYIDEPEKDMVMTLLADTYLNLVEGGIQDSIASYESVINQLSDGNEDTVLYESALYKLAGLHVFADKKKQAVSEAVRLFEVSSNDSYWLKKMQASKWHRWILNQPDIIRLFDDAN